MRYYMKQKISLFQNFNIFDEDNHKVLRVDQKKVSLTRQSRIIDVETGDVLARVKQKLVSIRPTMIVEVDGEEVAKITKKITVFKDKYKIDALDWKIKGDIWDYNYEIIDGSGKEIADISKKIFSLTDAFEFNIADEEVNPVLVIAVILAIDYVKDTEGE